MMLHRHFEDGNKDNTRNMTKLDNVTPVSDSTDPNDPLYVPVNEEQPKRPGRPRKNT